MSRGTTWILPALLALAALWAPVTAQEPELIVLDPNHPLIQNPGTVSQGGASTAEPELVPLPAQGVDAREVLAGLWFRYRALLERGSAEEATKQLGSALEFMGREGIRSAPEIASTLLTLAQRHMVRGDYPLAKETFGIAARFEPRLSPAHFGLALALLRGDRDLSGAASALWTGLRRLLGDPEAAYDVAGNLLLVGYLGLLLGAAAALLLLCARSAPGFFHDLHERSAGRLSEDGARLVGWSLLALPLIVMLPVVWTLSIWGAILLTYLRRAERVVALSALFLLAAGGPVIRLLGWHYGMATNPEARALIQAIGERHDTQQAEALTRLAVRYPEETIFPFLLGSTYRAEGRLDEAAAAYRRVLEIEPRDVSALINLGNVHFLRQELPL
ncbi:MAG TPA: tetratricopeptide repeat protein, partial [Candidatus Polarisedimenticolia bacterium]|nr:tetratricopeptide repeat protein [Candidatus Polarisedimenticolia bacterium]